MVNISDFKIRASVQLDDKEARAKLESLKKLSQNDPIDLKINLKGIIDGLNKIETMFNNAFKLDNASLRSLESVERTLKEINNLSRDVQNNLFSNKKSSNRLGDEAKRIKEDNKVMLAGMIEEQKMRKQAERENEKIRKKEQQALQHQRKEQEQMYRQMFDDIDKQQKQRVKREQEYSKLFDKVDNRDDKEQQGLLNQYKELESTISKLQSQMNKGLGEESIKRTSNEIERLTRQLDVVKSLISSNDKVEIIDTKNANKDLIEFNKNLSKIEDVANSAMKRLNSMEFINLTDEEGRIDSLKNELNQLIDMCQRPIDFTIDTGQALNRIDEIQQEVKNLQQVENLRGSFEEVESSIAQAFGTNYVSQFRADLESLENTARSLDGSFDIAFANMNSQFKNTQSQIKNINNEYKRTSKFWSDFSSSVAQYSMGNMIGDSLASGIRGSIQAFKDLDSAMVNVKRVAETSDIDSSLDLENIKNQAIDIGREIGASSTDVINGIASSLQAGMGSMKESIAVAKDALTLSAVADMNSEDASAAINTMVNGFKIRPLKEVQREMNGTIVKTNELTEAMDYLNFAG